MKVFVTGASGYVGSAVAEAFARRGHSVAGLVRSPQKGAALEKDEIRPVLGDMRNPASYSAAAAEAEVLVHCAAELSADYEALDRSTLETLLDVATKGRSERTLIYTSGVWLYGDTGGRLVDEAQAAESSHLIAWRGRHEQMVLETSGKFLRGLVIRPGCVYGRRGGLPGMWFESAAKDGAAAVVGDGLNRWAMIHAQDLADLYVRAAESRLSGELFNATDRSRFTVLEMAQAASRAAGAGGKVKNVDVAQAKKSMGVLAEGLALNQHVDSSKAAAMLGWQPRFGGFVDMAERCWRAWSAARAKG